MKKTIKTELINRIYAIYYSRKFQIIKKIWFNLILKKYIQNKISKRLKKKSEKDPIKILFFINNICFFKYEELIKILLKDKKYQPLIVPCPVLYHSKGLQKLSESQIIQYCKSKNFPYLKAYDIKNETYLTAKELKPDLITYSQPYDVAYPYFWKIERFYKKCLIFYYPYGFHINYTHKTNNYFYNQFIHNIAWKIFYNTKNGESFFYQNIITRGKNYMYIGNLLKNKLKFQLIDSSIWKDKEHKLKRIIWAPHHWFEDVIDLPKSSFLNICENMLLLPNIFKNQIEIIFKPHPALKEKLCRFWGKEKTNKYFEFWKNNSNSNIIEDISYVDLFSTSDALIHDCITFMMDYLMTTKPALYINNDNLNNYFSGLALDCHDMHYQGYNFYDILNFIKDIVIDENDFMKNERTKFISENFDIYDEVNPANRIYEEFEKLTYL